MVGKICTIGERQAYVDGRSVYDGELKDDKMLSANALRMPLRKIYAQVWEAMGKPPTILR
jgi:hypothetical protein